MESGQRSFGQIHFGNVSLGDVRRNQRLPQLVDAMVQHPGGTLPEKFSRPADLEAFYLLCSAEEVTHPGGCQVAPDGVPVLNLAFDVTPHRYVTGIITENGVAYPPFKQSLRRMVERGQV